MICNLLPTELFAVVMFFAVIAIVQVSALVVLLRAYCRIRAGERIKSIVCPVGWLCLAMAAMGILCFLYAVFIEPFELETTWTIVRSPKLNDASAPIRLVHISDIHSDPFVRVEEKLPLEIEKLKPDLIVFTGDACNSANSLPIFRRCISRIASIAPTFVVNGNHDSRRGRDLDLYGGTGATILACQTKTQVVKNVQLSVSGVGVDSETCMPEVLQVLPESNFNIFLYHYPSVAEMVSKYNVDLFCAGHVHGGQVRMPWYGAIVTRSETGKKYEFGLYSVEKMYLYVSRGIGMVGDFVPRVRFLCKPEIALLELVSEHADTRR
ncbi:MAG: metallophosphoesterase [Candidatus Obscuribacterales bacterium]|nr:metallophosphoesterase [Candidatus Obscuribacterales bacterium]